MSDVPEGWRSTTLGGVARYVNGFAFKPHHWGEHGLPIIRIAQMQTPDAACDYYSGYVPEHNRIDDGDLLFSWSATLKVMIWNRGPALLNQHIFKVIPDEGQDLSFVHHLLDHCLADLAGQSHGTTMKHIKRSDLLPHTVAVPPLREQRHIAKIIDTIDEAIRRTEQVIDKLQQMQRGLLHDLLTRGVDDSGELRDPVPQPHEFQPTERGLRPRAWQNTTLRDLADFINGFAFKPDHWKTVGLPIIRIAQLTDPEADCDRYPGTLAEHYRIDSGDLVFSWSATLTTRIWDRGPAYLNQHLFKVVPRGGTDIGFLHYLLDFYMDELAGQSHGTTMKHIKRSDLLPFRVFAPPPSEQVAIARIAGTHDKKVDTEKVVLHKLRLLKRGLMNDLLAGRVRVSALEQVTV